MVPLRPRLAAILVALWSLYLATLTRDYYWDGVTFAWTIEAVYRTGKGANRLFHQNHLLYSVLGYGAYAAARGLGLEVRALDLLQVASTLAGACGVAALYALARRMGCAPASAGLGAALFGVSAGWWRCSTDVDAYSVSALALLVCALVLLGPTRRPWTAGGLLALAMLLHQLASLFFAVALVAVLTDPDFGARDRLRFLARFALAAWAPTAALYALGARLNGATSVADVLVWSVSNPSGVTFSPDLVHGLLWAFEGTLGVLVGHDADAMSRSADPAALVSLVAAAFCFAIATIAITAGRIAARRNGPRVGDGRRVALVAGTWAGVYMIFLLAWEPGLTYYRVFTLPALALFVSRAARRRLDGVRRPERVAAVAAVLALGLANLGLVILPRTEPDANPLYASARAAGFGPNDVVFFAKPDQTAIVFMVFNDDASWLRVAPDEPGLADRIDGELRSGRRVWLDDAAEDAIDATALGLTLADRTGGRFTQVERRRPESCK